MSSDPELGDERSADRPMRAPATATLPPAVRERVVGLAADALGAMPAAEVPARLKAVSRFTPGRRARMGAADLAAVLDNDSSFRARVSEVARGRYPELAADLEAARVPPAADPVDVTALAYLFRLPGWEDWVARVGASEATDQRATRAAEAEIDRLRGQLERAQSQGLAAREEQRRQTTQTKAELAALRGSLAESRRRAAAAEEVARRLGLESEEAARAADLRVAAAESEVRRLRARVAEVEAALEASRQASRAGRTAEDVRLRLLLDTVVEAAHGLRRELALPPGSASLRPADAVLPARAEQAAGATRSRALEADDPAVVDQLLALPQVHLIVDGYNVTKSAYGSLPLEAQRSRLIGGLASLAAQTGAEVTCVFDGANIQQSAAPPTRRGVRVRFSPAGITADSVIRQLVRAEPAGRPLVVVSSDREVVDGVVESGARAVTSRALVRRLERA